LLPLKDNIPTRTFPVLTVAIIAINIVVYFLFQEGGFSAPGNEQRVIDYSVIPYEVTHPGDECGPPVEGGSEIICEGQPGVSGEAPDQPPTWLTLLTSMFMHGSLLHLGGNMLFLWIFGNNIEDSMGKPKFLVFYLAGGLVASLAQIVVDPSATIPTLGASGAIAAVLGGYALLYPRARVVTLIFIVIFVTLLELPALLVLGLWFLLQLLDASSQPLTGGGVAYFAHIGGFVFGLLAVKLFASRYDPDYDRRQRVPVY